MRIDSKIYAYSRISELPLIIACSQSFFRAATIACSRPRAAITIQSCYIPELPGNVATGGSADSAQERVYTQ